MVVLHHDAWLPLMLLVHMSFKRLKIMFLLILVAVDVLYGCSCCSKDWISITRCVLCWNEIVGSESH